MGSPFSENTVFQVLNQSKDQTNKKDIWLMDPSPVEKHKNQKKSKIQNKIKHTKLLSIKTIAKGFSKTCHLQLSRVQHSKQQRALACLE